MNRTLKESVTWFLDNLKLLIEDIALERRNPPTHIDVYFDTIDVWGALLGMEAFHGSKGSNMQSFFEDRTLVQCLAAAGWFGPVQLLPPHQAEFLNRLNVRLREPSEENPKARAQEFLYQIRKATSIDVVPATDGGGSRRTDIVEFVRERASSAIDLFKALQCIRGVNWQRRLVKWRQQGRLIFQSTNFDYSSILNSPHFDELKRAFDQKRPNTTVNNFADAAAVVHLISQVLRYRKGEVKRVPRFFVSSHLFFEAVAEARGVLPMLNYQGERKYELSVLRNEDYFKFLACFRAPSPTAKVAETTVDPARELESLDKLRLQIEEILKAQEPLTPEAVDKVIFNERPLTKVIEELQQLSFFENVWIPYSAQQEAQDALRELGESALEIGSEASVEAMETAISAARRELEANIKGYTLVSTLWRELEKASYRLHSSLRNKPGKALDVFWDLGLLRFDFPKDLHDRISTVLRTTIYSGDEEAERDARISVIKAYYAYAKLGDVSARAGELGLASAVLWVANMDKELTHLLEKILPELHYSLKLIYAAAEFRLKGDAWKGQKVVEGLKNDFEREPDMSRRVGLAVGLAYLNFHLWGQRGFGPAWRAASWKSPNASPMAGQKLINDAIMFARTAYTSSEDIDIQKHVYALNQYLYYLVEGSDDSQLETMRTLAEQLAAFKENPNLWQYRFEDTLARYFHRLACGTDSPDRKRELMKLAKTCIEAACEGPYRDQEVESYRTMFDVQYANLR